jgi:hypothetical protein
MRLVGPSSGRPIGLADGRVVTSVPPVVRDPAAAGLPRAPVTFLASLGSFLKKEKTTALPAQFRIFSLRTTP